jgi:hypothetical protein
MVFILKDIMKKLLFISIFTLIFTLSWAQCLPQCSNIIKNGSFTSGWSNWTKQTGWGISTYGGNSTSATNSIDNSPSAGYSISQTITNTQGTKVFRLEFDAYPQSPNPGTSYLDFYLDNTKFIRLTNANGGSSATYTLLNGTEGNSVSNLTFSSWKRGFSVNIPWVSNDSSVTLKITFVSTTRTAFFPSTGDITLHDAYQPQFKPLSCVNRKWLSPTSRKAFHERPLLQHAAQQHGRREIADSP